MSAHEFTIKTSELDAGGKDYTLPVRPAWVRGVLEDSEAKATGKEGVLSVRASKSGADVVIHGTLDASLHVACARCLDPFDADIHADLSVIYVPGTKAKEASADGEVEYTLEDAEADTMPYDGDTVVLDDLVRDELLLGLPMIPLCSEACPGMSPAPETDGAASDAIAKEKPVDPRLAPLAAFRVKATK